MTETPSPIHTYTNIYLHYYIECNLFQLGFKDLEENTKYEKPRSVIIFRKDSQHVYLCSVEVCAHVQHLPFYLNLSAIP